ncbi:hypothetical protein [Streptomyces sp. NPDC002057]|uniref:hypothetical protein n=1 Tax=Streptomyces sp. NPDC002057 TaxID=3154664 RepID=UPI00332F281B
MNMIGTGENDMRHRLRTAVVTTAMVTAALSGCTDGAGRPVAAPPPSASASPSVAEPPSPSASRPATRAEVAGRTRAALSEAVELKPDAPGPAGLMLIDAWPNGEAAYVWETADHRLCSASVAGDLVFRRTCVTRPNDPPVAKHPRISGLFTSFANGWGRVFAADHQEVTSASCGGEPVEVLRIGTTAKGARTLYAVWFPDHTKGEILLTLRRNTTTSRAPFRLGDAGDRSCAATPAR